MGSVPSTNPNISNLLQTLSTASPQLSSLLSAPNVQSALAKSSPSDVVQLSQQALELQQTDLLFGSSIGTQSLTSDPDSLLSSLYSGSADGASNAILQALESSSANAANGAASIAAGATSAQPSPSTTAASGAASSQAQELAALLGSTPSIGSVLSTQG
jgi:pectin methylesterase-like acyl-CoA thioesterase